MTIISGRNWRNPQNGNVRVYIDGAKDIKRANTFFCKEKENAKYIWKCDGGYFHADKCYNGWLIKNLVNMFPDRNISKELES